jgi:protein-L-isoaspartate(D-aspartate) O-methyltransferase
MDMTQRKIYKAQRRPKGRKTDISRGRRTPETWMAQAALAKMELIDQAQGAPFPASADLRQTMVDRQLRPFDVTDVTVLQRFLDVPRERFLPEDLAPLAYSDTAIALRSGAGEKIRTLLPPLVLARFIQNADIKPTDSVLEVAVGSGYSAALLSGLAAKVVSLESETALAEQAKATLEAIGASNVRVETGPLEVGFPSAGPYDVILVYGAVEDGLDALFEQLTPDGHLLAICRHDQRSGQQAVRYERSNGKAAGERPLFDAAAPILCGFKKPPAFVF